MLTTLMTEASLASLAEQLEEETRVLDRIVYKNYNQHRRGLYFASLRMMQRSCAKLLRLEASKCFADVVVGVVGLDADLSLVNSIGEAVNKLALAAKLARQARVRANKAAVRFSSLVAQGFFLPFAVVCLALTSTVCELANKFADAAANAYRYVASAWLGKLRALAGGLSTSERRILASTVMPWLVKSHALVGKPFISRQNHDDDNGDDIGEAL
jgi:hypothetical protein